MANKISLFHIIYRIITILVIVIVFMFIRSLFLSPTTNDPIQKTKIKMYFIAKYFIYAMEKYEFIHITEYFNYLTNEQNIPRTINKDVIYQVFYETFPPPLSSSEMEYLDNWLIDVWKQPIIVTLTTNQNGEFGIMMHSFGKNKRDDKGKKDDILLWFDSDMYNSGFINRAYLKRSDLLQYIGIDNPTKEQIDNFKPPYKMKNIQDED